MGVIDEVSAVNETNLSTLGQWKSYDHSCSDEYSTFNVPDRLDKQEDVENNIYSSKVYLWIVTALFLCELVPILCWGLLKIAKKCNEKRRQERKK